MLSWLASILLSLFLNGWLEQIHVSVGRQAMNLTRGLLPRKTRRGFSARNGMLPGRCGRTRPPSPPAAESAWRKIRMSGHWHWRSV